MTNSKFGKIIDHPGKPVVLFFHSTFSIFENENPLFNSKVKELALRYGSNIKVIKISKNVNEDLFEALRIKTLPTCIIYLDGHMDFRQDKLFSFNAVDDYLIDKIHKVKTNIF